MKRIHLAVFVGWLVPGAGYWLMGQRAKSLVTGAVIIALFAAGVAVGGEVVPTGLGGALHLWEWAGANVIGAISLVGRAGCGIIALVATVFHLGGKSSELPYYEIGGAFTAVAGVLNVLIAISLLDHAEEFQRKPPGR